MKNANVKWDFPVRRVSSKRSTSNKISAMRKRARELIDQIEAIKPLYKELDELTDKLFAAGFVAGEGLAIVDNFAEKNTVWKASAIRRFELKRSL